MNRPLILGIVAILVHAACTAASAPTASVTGDAIPACESIPRISPVEDAFRDTPIYVANEMPTEAVRDWARTKPGFEDLWIDRDHSGWVVVAFSSDAAARQAELAKALPGVGVAVVGVDWKKADLERLQQRVVDELSSEFGVSAAIDILRGRVEVGIGVLSDDRIEVVRSRFAGERVCVSGLDPGDAVPEGPQPTSGEGWRLLASEKLGEAYRTGIATEERAYQGLWDRIGLSSDPPRVDFDTEAVIWFGAVYGSSCPDIRLDGVVFDRDRQLLHGMIVLPSTYAFCTADANPHAFVVAVERTRLPSPPFAIQLGSEDPPGGAPEERTIVEADLRVAGSVPGPGEVHADPSLPEPDVVEPGSVVEPDFEVQFRMNVRCGIEWLGRLNDVSWRTTVPDGTDRFVPPEWESVVDDGSVIVSVLLTTEPEAIVTAAAADHSVVYWATKAAPPACAQG